MTIALNLSEAFGAQLGNGDAAADYRLKKIEPAIRTAETLILDFTGIRSANSSFMNALVTGIVENHGVEITDKIIFKGCNPLLRVLVESALDLGAQKLAAKAG